MLLRIAVFRQSIRRLIYLHQIIYFVHSAETRKFPIYTRLGDTAINETKAASSRVTGVRGEVVEFEDILLIPNGYTGFVVSFANPFTALRPVQPIFS